MLTSPCFCVRHEKGTPAPQRDRRIRTLKNNYPHVMHTGELLPPRPARTTEKPPVPEKLRFPKTLPSLGFGPLQTCPSAHDPTLLLLALGPRPDTPSSDTPPPLSKSEMLLLPGFPQMSLPPTTWLGVHAGFVLPERGPKEGGDNGHLPVQHPQPHTQVVTEQALKGGIDGLIPWS